ncbi:endospore germination permease [Thalassobacillus sp. B23F22_16]|uniref:endospore germination permease n=1 Tax=Thalassobacillus sp. B23F22_16 TaxID=3459513 RepID=UPI00373FA54F
MMKDEPISYLQLLFLIMMSSGFYNHVIIGPPILDAAKRDAWISSLMTTFSFTVILIIIYIIHRITKDQSVLQYIQNSLGKVGKILFAIPILVYVILSGYITYFDTVTWTNISYLPKTPKIYLGILTILVILVILRGGMQTLAITAGVLLPLVVVLGFFVTIANMGNKEYNLLFPVLAEGWEPVWRGFLLGSGGALDLGFILLIQHQVKKKMSFWKYIIIGAVLVNLLVTPVMGSIAMFGPEHASELRYPAYEQWRMVTVGTYISHVDYFTIYQWLSGAIIRIALVAHLIPYLFPIKTEKAKWRIQMCFLSGLLLSLYLPLSDMQFLNLLKDFVLPWIVYAMGTYLFVLLVVIATIHRRKAT